MVPDHPLQETAFSRAKARNAGELVDKLCPHGLICTSDAPSADVETTMATYSLWSIRGTPAPNRTFQEHFTGVHTRFGYCNTHLSKRLMYRTGNAREGHLRFPHIRAPGRKAKSFDGATSCPILIFASYSQFLDSACTKCVHTAFVPRSKNLD